MPVTPYMGNKEGFTQEVNEYISCMQKFRNTQRTQQVQFPTILRRMVKILQEGDQAWRDANQNALNEDLCYLLEFKNTEYKKRDDGTESKDSFLDDLKYLEKWAADNNLLDNWIVPQVPLQQAKAPVKLQPKDMTLRDICEYGSEADLVAHLDSLGYFKSRKDYVNQIIENKERNTPMHVVCRHRDQAEAVKIAKILLDTGASITQRNQFEEGNVYKPGYDALHTSIREHNINLFKLMTLKDVNGAYLYGPNFMQLGEYNRTLIHTCVFHGYLDMLKLIPENVVRALINNVTDGKETALHSASFRAYVPIVCWLDDKGANHKIRDGMGCTPLMTAIFGNRKDVATVFYNTGNWLSATDQDNLLNNNAYKKQRGAMAQLLKEIYQQQSQVCDAILEKEEKLNAEVRSEIKQENSGAALPHAGLFASNNNANAPQENINSNNINSAEIESNNNTSHNSSFTPMNQ